MNIETKVNNKKSGEKTLETVGLEFGPNTAGLAQRMYVTRQENKQPYVLKKAYILSCGQNQF
ncbi:MAG: hypothetical protein Q8L34_06175 [Candidatus Woesearchaeota archaeon]|nr:hypothetical protein [Candidatus Woesearchaeota archaeon]